MQAVKERKRVSQRVRQDIGKRKIALVSKKRSGRTEAEDYYPLCSRSNDYLKEVFREIPLLELEPIFSEPNYNYLYDSAKNYFRLLGEEFAVQYNPSELRNLYDSLDNVLKRGVLSIIEKDDSLSFRIDEPCRTQTLFYIPCEILDKTNGRFREILLHFFRILKYVHNLTSLKDNYSYSAILDELNYQEELRQECGDTEMYYEHETRLKSYRDGDIGSTLSLVDKLPDYAPGELIDIIEKYSPASEKEKALLSVIHKGLDEFLCSEDSIFNYVGTPDFAPDSGNTPMDSKGLFMIIYAADLVCENMIEYINSDCQECESEFFCSGQIELTPDTDVLMEKNDFVEPFLDWLIELSDKLYNFKTKSDDNK